MELASFPSPSISALNIGPLTIHFYALCIIAGIIVAVWWGERRFIARGGAPGVVTDVAYWAVPSGIVGGRLYHLATSWNSERTFLDAIAIWRGGLGIWGAIGLGAGGAYLRYRMLLRKGSLHGVELQSLPSFATFMDALAPGIVIAQAIGRWGNWFNVELFGRPSSLPWALQVPANKRPNGFGDFETFHPTFLYESLWCIVVALLLIGVARKGFLRSGGIFLLYVASYSFGRFWIENLRIDTSEEIFGLRFNVWVSLGAFIFAAIATFGRRNRPMAR
ncbi:MAG: prolipoprotein diacylglyceryl transferase [Actinobacteria bacterium]|nr:prolipoprotein diacylglyceryl transferase [Actinomycetota bacterium]